MTRILSVVDRPVVIAFCFVIVLLILGGTYNQQFLSALYLLQQLRVASFLGIIASGAMVVILLGHIDLSIPWVVTIGGIAATAVAGWWGARWTALGVPLAVACGALVGLANGLGVAFLRIPSMVFTLGMNAVVVLHPWSRQTATGMDKTVDPALWALVPPDVESSELREELQLAIRKVVVDPPGKGSPIGRATGTSAIS